MCKAKGHGASVGRRDQRAAYIEWVELAACSACDDSGEGFGVIGRSQAYQGV